MKLLDRISSRKIETLKYERKQVEIDLMSFSENTFCSAWLSLALAIINLKIELWRCL